MQDMMDLTAWYANLTSAQYMALGGCQVLSEAGQRLILSNSSMYYGHNALMGNPSLLADIQVELATGAGFRQRWDLARNPGVTLKAQALLLGAGDPDTDEGLAKNPGTHPQTQRALKDRGHSLGILACNPSLSEEIQWEFHQEALAGNESSRKLLYNAALLPELRDHWIENGDILDLFALCDNPGLSEDEQLRLVERRPSTVRGLAYHTQHASVLLRVFEHGNYQDHQTVYGRGDLTAETLLDVLRNPHLESTHAHWAVYAYLHSKGATVKDFRSLPAALVRDTKSEILDIYLEEIGDHPLLPLLNSWKGSFQEYCDSFEWPTAEATPSLAGWYASTSLNNALNLAESRILSSRGQEVILEQCDLPEARLRLLANPALCTEHQVRHVDSEALAQNPGITLEAQKALITQETGHALSILSKNPSLHPDMQRRLREATSAPIQLYSNSALDEVLQEEILTDAFAGLLTSREKHTFYRNPELKEGVVDKITRTESEEYLCSLVRIPGISEALQIKTAEAWPEALHGLAPHTNFTSVQTLIARNGPPFAMLALINRTDAKSEALKVALLRGDLDDRQRQSLMLTLLCRGDLARGEIDALRSSVVKDAEDIPSWYLKDCDREAFLALLPTWRGTLGELKEAVLLTSLTA